MNLHEINSKVGGGPERHRVGRGPGSGWGTTSGRGENGARCRSGYHAMLYREGGQMPITRRLPKRGFNNRAFAKVWAFINLHQLDAEFKDGDVVTPEELLKRGLIPKIRSGLKVLGEGSLEKKLTIRAHRVSATAKAAIEAKGGTVESLQARGDDARKDWKAKRGKGKARTRREAAEARARKAAAQKPAGKPKK